MFSKRLALKGILCSCSCVALFALAAGCGGPSLAKVSGTVKYQGKPVPNASIVFMNDKNNAYPGRTNADGEYTITAIPYGDYRVYFQEPPRDTPKGPKGGRPGSPGMGPPKGTQMPDSMKGAYDNVSKAAIPTVELPKEYYDYRTTKLTFTVKQSTETNPIDIL
jgi:hypothetical protein